MLESQFFNLPSLQICDFAKTLQSDDGNDFAALPRLLWKAYVKPKATRLLFLAIEAGIVPADIDCSNLRGRFVCLANFAVPDPCSVWTLHKLALRYHKDPNILRSRRKTSYWNSGMERRYREVGQLLSRMERGCASAQSLKDTQPCPPRDAWVLVVEKRSTVIAAAISAEVKDGAEIGLLDVRIHFSTETTQSRGDAAATSTLPALAKAVGRKLGALVCTWNAGVAPIVWRQLGSSQLGESARLGWALGVRWRPAPTLLKWGSGRVLSFVHDDERVLERDLSDEARELLSLWWVRNAIARRGARVVASRVWSDQADVPLGYVHCE